MLRHFKTLLYFIANPVLPSTHLRHQRRCRAAAVHVETSVFTSGSRPTRCLRVGGVGRSCIPSPCRGRPDREDEPCPLSSRSAPSAFTKTPGAAGEPRMRWARFVLLAPSPLLNEAPGEAARGTGFFLFDAARGWQALKSSTVSPQVRLARAPL